eukprot:TRINITY_DN2148_c0_g1_i1.p1 TRINITY_DN2148_c0_g1~~TRINITY_DN2148_c0_g1_i1.p1  ORF type:complete len:266 (+),score=61.97 TRINITY_DN2148_c0_g1_i1:66-863(+)
MAQRQTMIRDSDTFYVEDCRQVQGNTHSIQTLTGQISKLVGTLEADKEFHNCRRMVDDAVRQASETKTILLRIREHQQQAENPAEKNNRRMMYQKLSDNLAITARVLEDVVKRFTAEERKHIALLEKQILTHQADGCSGGVGFGRENMNGDTVGGNEQQPMAALGNAEQATGEELQRERAHALRRVDEDMRSLQRIYTDLATANEDPHSSFESMESHIASASTDIEQGNDYISMANNHWTDDFKRKTLGGFVSIVCLYVFVFHVL